MDKLVDDSLGVLMNSHLVEYSGMIQHSGVKGMKWGVWNEETRARKLGRSRNKVKDKEARKADKALAKQQFKEKNAYYKKNYGMGYNKYEKLRARTLQSEDPKVVVKGMKTLSNKELTAKANRLEQAQRIKRLAAEDKMTKMKEQQKRSEVVKSSVAYDVTNQAAKQAVSSVASSVVTKSVTPSVLHRTNYYANKANERFNKRHQTKKPIGFS